MELYRLRQPLAGRVKATNYGHHRSADPGAQTQRAISPCKPDFSEQLPGNDYFLRLHSVASWGATYTKQACAPIF